MGRDDGLRADDLVDSPGVDRRWMRRLCGRGVIADRGVERGRRSVNTDSDIRNAPRDVITHCGACPVPARDHDSRNAIICLLCAKLASPV
nr:hypothetical protein CFP56_02496 [Quercus suber]